jgi:signal transduction histidine kinase
MEEMIDSIGVTPLVEAAWRAVQTEGMTLETDGVDGTSLRGDRSLLRNVFENLFRNVTDHNDPPVTVTVGRIDGDNDGIYIEDDGAGIPDDERATVFDHGYTTSDDGTGFGLSIVDEIVETHGWHLLVAEGTEGGARFEITGVTLSDA